MRNLCCYFFLFLLFFFYLILFTLNCLFQSGALNFNKTSYNNSNKIYRFVKILTLLFIKHEMGAMFKRVLVGMYVLLEGCMTA